MAKSKAYMSLCPQNPPEWYWVNGIHDAGIIGVEVFEFPFDYNEFQLMSHLIQTDYENGGLTEEITEKIIQNFAK